MPLGRLLSRLLEEVRRAFEGLAVAAREQAIEALELQERELESIFYTLVAAPLAGLPITPTGLLLELAPILGDEIVNAVNRAALWADLIADYFSNLGGEW